MNFSFKIAQAIITARQIHADVNQTYGGKPYFESHVMMVLEYALKYIHLIPKKYQETVILAILYHDIIEDCRLTASDLIKLIGLEATKIVFAVTNEKGWTRSDRANDKYYAGILKEKFALFVKLCDRLANIKNSFNTKHKMFGGYCVEHPHFKEKLYKGRSKNKYDTMWGELDYFLIKHNEQISTVK